MSDQKIALKSTIWRRFTFKDESKKQAAVALIKQKGLSREDIALLLDAIKIKEQSI
ncbi:MAG: hypothetical protein K2K89_05635 [Ruminococcus sp.]|nr:hypothetical protein [Ruminococcus sp.]